MPEDAASRLYPAMNASKKKRPAPRMQAGRFCHGGRRHAPNLAPSRNHWLNVRAHFAAATASLRCIQNGFHPGNCDG
jgi:hypothetical protein